MSSEYFFSMSTSLSWVKGSGELESSVSIGVSGTGVFPFYSGTGVAAGLTSLDPEGSLMIFGV